MFSEARCRGGNGRGRMRLATLLWIEVVTDNTGNCTNEKQSPRSWTMRHERIDEERIRMEEDR
jgi:hypothetical protein